MLTPHEHFEQSPKERVPGTDHLCVTNVFFPFFLENSIQFVLLPICLSNKKLHGRLNRISLLERRVLPGFLVRPATFEAGMIYLQELLPYAFISSHLSLTYILASRNTIIVLSLINQLQWNHVVSSDNFVICLHIYNSLERD